MLWRTPQSWLLLGAFFSSGCQEYGNPGVTARFDTTAGAGFFDAPFPIAHRSREDGSLRIADFPNPDDNAAVVELLALLEEGHGGFGLNGGVFIPFDGAIDGSRMPADPAASLEPDATVFLVDVDPDSPRRGERIPIETTFKTDAESHSPANLLVALPYAGFALAPHTHYALLVRRGLGDSQGRALFSPDTLDDALNGFLPAGELRTAFELLGTWLSETGIATTDLAAATVFETGGPLDETIVARVDPAAPPMNGAVLVSDASDYCGINVSTSLPDYRDASGRLVLDAQGKLSEQGRRDVDATFIVPHGDMPASGFPLVIYLGSVEGGPLEIEGGSHGEGPARYYAARGIAAMSTVSLGGDADDLGVMRDRIRQNIHDVTSLVALAQSATLDASLCPQASSATGSFSFDRLFIHGHSEGSVVASASIALEPELGAAVLSGAGGSWIHRLVTGVPVSPDIFGAEDEPDRFDPMMTLFQTAFESVEPMSWGPRVIREPLTAAKQMLLIQGVPDSHLSPRSINAYAMSAGLDLVLPEIEPSARADYELAGRNVYPSPITGNITGIGAQLMTGVTIQHASASDGHYVLFELEDVKYRYGCFVASMTGGDTGTVPAPASDALAPCP